MNALQQKTYDLTAKLGNLDNQCQADYRDWLFAVTCKNKALELPFREGNSTLEPGELVVVDMESMFKTSSQAPSYVYVDSSAGQAGGSGEMKPELGVGDYRQNRGVEQSSLLNVYQDEYLVKSSLTRFEISDLYESGKKMNSILDLNSQALSLRKKTSQEFIKDHMILSAYEDEFLRVIHEKQPSSFYAQFTEIDFFNIYIKTRTSAIKTF